MICLDYKGDAIRLVVGALLLAASAKAQPRQVLVDRGIQLGAFGLLFAQLRGEALHLFLERLAVVLLRGGAHIAAGGEDVAVLRNLFQRGGLAVAPRAGLEPATNWLTANRSTY